MLEKIDLDEVVKYEVEAGEWFYEHGNATELSNSDMLCMCIGHYIMPKYPEKMISREELIKEMSHDGFCWILSRYCMTPEEFVDDKFRFFEENGVHPDWDEIRSRG